MNIVQTLVCVQKKRQLRAGGRSDETDTTKYSRSAISQTDSSPVQVACWDFYKCVFGGIWLRGCIKILRKFVFFRSGLPSVSGHVAQCWSGRIAALWDVLEVCFLFFWWRRPDFSSRRVTWKSFWASGTLFLSCLAELLKARLARTGTFWKHKEMRSSVLKMIWMNNKSSSSICISTPKCSGMFHVCRQHHSNWFSRKPSLESSSNSLILLRSCSPAKALWEWRKQVCFGYHTCCCNYSLETSVHEVLI